MEEKFNQQFSDLTAREARTTSQGLSGKSQDERQRKVETLLEARQKRAGVAAQSSEPLEKAVDDIDTESIKQTQRTLQNLDTDTIDSVVDLERVFGRDVHQVRIDLESQIARGGRSTNKARGALNQLDRVLRRSRLLSATDSVGALRQSMGETGPKLNNFLGSGGGTRFSKTELHQPGQSPDAEGNGDADVARTLLQRLRRGGSKINDSDRERLQDLQLFGQ